MNEIQAEFEPHRHSHAEIAAHIARLHDRIIELEVRIAELSKEREHWHGAWHLKWAPGL